MDWDIRKWKPYPTVIAKPYLELTRVEFTPEFSLDSESLEEVWLARALVEVPDLVVQIDAFICGISPSIAFPAFKSFSYALVPVNAIRQAILLTLIAFQIGGKLEQVRILEAFFITWVDVYLPHTSFPLLRIWTFPIWFGFHTTRIVPHKFCTWIRMGRLARKHHIYSIECIFALLLLSNARNVYNTTFVDIRRSNYPAFCSFRIWSPVSRSPPLGF